MIKKYNTIHTIQYNADKLDTNKLWAAPLDLSKLTYVVTNEIVKKREIDQLVYDELVKKLNYVKQLMPLIMVN